jgi:hypothetical protein
MTLGFSVEALIPAGRGGGALKMGLRRLSEAEWLQQNPDRAARRLAFDRHPEALIVRPEAVDAACEVAAMLDVGGGLSDAARSCWEDLCILQPDGAGQYRLTAGAVAFPTDWRLADKMGLPLTAIHAPIHGYAEQLSAGVDHFFATLRSGQIFGRANWFVVASDTWRYMPGDEPARRFAHVNAANAGETLFVRCERQTLRRLPQSGAVLFTIGIHVAPLGSLSAAAVRQVTRSVATVSEGEHERRAAPFYADALHGYARRRDEMEPAGDA